MSVNILELINTAIEAELLNRVAALIGEDEQKTAVAFRSAVPAILGGLIKKSTTLDGAEQVLRSLHGFNGGVLLNFESIVTGGETENFSKIGTGISQAIFGGEYDTAVNAIAEHSGVTPLTSATLLGLATPVVLGVVGHEKETSDLNRNGLINFLHSQKLLIVQGTQHELLRALGLSQFFELNSDPTPVATSQPDTTPNEAVVGTSVVATPTAVTAEASLQRKKSGGLLKVLVPLLLIAAMGFGGWQFMQSRKSAELSQQETIPATTPISVETVTDLVSDQPQLSDVEENELSSGGLPASGDGQISKEPEPAELAYDTTDVEAGEIQIDTSPATHGNETTDTLADSDLEAGSELESNFDDPIENEPQDVYAGTELPETTVGTSDDEGTLAETTNASANILDTSLSGSAAANPSDVATTTDQRKSVVAESIPESIPTPEEVRLADELGFGTLEEHPTPADAPWKSQEAILDTRNVVKDATQNSLQLTESTETAVKELNSEHGPAQAVNQTNPKVIKGQPYQGGVIETYRPHGVIEANRPQQAVQLRVIQGQPYQGGVVYNAVPSQPTNQPGVQAQPYEQSQGQYQLPQYPAPQYYQGQYYEPAPYQQPLFNGRIMRRLFPLFN